MKNPMCFRNLRRPFVSMGWMFVFVFMFNGCAVTDFSTGYDDGEIANQEAPLEGCSEVSILHMDGSDWSLSNRAIEEQFLFIMAQLHELSDLLAVEGRGERGLTPSQDVLSERVDTFSFAFLRFLESEMEDFRDPEVRAWAALRWGQIHASQLCLLIEMITVGRISRYSVQYDRLVEFVFATRHSVLNWISFLEMARSFEVAPWSEIAQEWLTLWDEEEEAPSFTFCREHANRLRRSMDVVGTSSRQEACDEGFEWSCQWLEAMRDWDDQ